MTREEFIEFEKTADNDTFYNYFKSLKNNLVLEDGTIVYYLLYKNLDDGEYYHVYGIDYEELKDYCRNNNIDDATINGGKLVTEYSSYGSSKTNEYFFSYSKNKAGEVFEEERINIEGQYIEY